MKPTKISHFVLMGDTLPRQAESDHQRPFSIIGSLKGTISKESFTQGHRWSSSFKDILFNDQKISYKGQDNVRCYLEMGSASKAVGRFFSRPSVSSLGTKRDKLLDDDDVHERSNTYKSETLVVEWSVNQSSSKEEIDDVVAARMENVKQLMKHGYRHFVLLNSLDLSLTPIDQNKTQTERGHASGCAKYFNEQLTLASKELATKSPSGSIEIFDAAKIYKDAYDDLAEHENLDEAFHNLLAQRFYQKYELEYNFQVTTHPATKDELSDLNDESQFIAVFKAAYTKRLDKDRHRFLSSHRTPRVMMDDALSLDNILMHALYNGGSRSLAVMKDLNWFDAKGNLYLDSPVLRDSLNRVQAAMDEAMKADMRRPI